MVKGSIANAAQLAGPLGSELRPQQTVVPSEMLGC